MEVYYAVILFIMGTILGSFYNVVGYRLPKGESIVYPSSHCPNCNHLLKPMELIPILSFIFQLGKCRNCKQKISWFYPIFELLGGVLFLLAYMSFGLTWELLIALTFISMVLIIIVSDYHYLIIPDSIIIITVIALIIEMFFIKGFQMTLIAIISGIIAFAAMLLLKKFGDLIFQKESMGGGDIKLMFIFGLMFDWPIALLSIFIASLIGLPISLIIMFKKNTHIVPFGPYLCAAALILLLLHVDSSTIMNILNH
ncbi:MAG: prepilin peptidase [Bacilli bacterium]